MQMQPLHIPVGHKYALITLPLYRAGHLQSIDLGDGYLAAEHLPVAVPEHWQTWVGTLQYEAIVGAAYYLVVHGPATDLGILDQDNRLLRTKVYHFYTGFTLAVPYVSHEPLIFLSGASHQEETDVREFTTYSPAYFVQGSNHSEISVARMRAAKRIGLNIESLAQTRNVENLGRLLTAFRNAHQAEELDTRLHQFVRVVEGFVLPRSKKKAVEFADRVAQLVSGVSIRDLRHLYTIRSTVEHLRGPTMAIEGTPKERHATLMLRAIQAETIARHLLATFLDTPELWPHFADTGSIRAFWKLSSGEKETLWRGRPDLATVKSKFALPDDFWLQTEVRHLDVSPRAGDSEAK